MVLTESQRLELGMKAPDFILPDTVSGKDISLNDIKGKQGTVIMFICNHCPFVIHERYSKYGTISPVTWTSSKYRGLV